jgi:hypothetical protein
MPLYWKPSNRWQVFSWAVGRCRTSALREACRRPAVPISRSLPIDAWRPATSPPGQPLNGPPRRNTASAIWSRSGTPRVSSLVSMLSSGTTFIHCRVRTSRLGPCLVQPTERPHEQENGNWNTQQPQQSSTSHFGLLCFGCVVTGETPAEFQGRSDCGHCRFIRRRETETRY